MALAQLTTNMSNPICQVHLTEMALKPAGVSKAGRPYNAFYSCPTKNADGSYCTYKPGTPVPNNNEANFVADLNAMKVQEKIEKRIEQKDTNILRSVALKGSCELHAKDPAVDVNMVLRDADLILTWLEK